jgi:hypothetical protein
MRLRCSGFCSLLMVGCADAGADEAPAAEIAGEWRAEAAVDGVEDRLTLRDDGTGEGELHRYTSFLSKVEYGIDVVADGDEFELAFDCDTFGCEMWEFTTACELDEAALVCATAPEWYHREFFEFTRVAGN